MKFNENLTKYQKYLKDNNINFALVFSNDEFLNECSDLLQNARYLLSGFSGTAGSMLISQDKAYLFVDGRYHIQVDEQTDLEFITPVKLQMGEKRDDKILEIIKKSKISNPKIVLPTNKISCQNYDNLLKTLQTLSPEMIKTEEDIVCKFFATKSSKDVYKIWNVGIRKVGKNVAEKLKGLRKYENNFLLIFSNDEICYLTNLRSNQIPYSSSLKCFALANAESICVFCDVKNRPSVFHNVAEGFSLCDFSEFDNKIKNIKTTVFYKPDSTPLSVIDKIKKAGINLKPIKQSPIAKMKSVKNKVEMDYIRDCYRKSDIGILNAIKFLNNKINNNEKITAGEFVNKLTEFEKEQGIIGLSFTPIFAINERSAIIHCTQFDENQVIKAGDLILLDFGVYFDGGYATDMTRTFVVGNKYDNELMKKVYTTVLKAFLNTLNIKITKDTTYFDLDKKARDIIKRAKLEGFNFNHGTGHGIGLNVHEMPPVLSPSKLAKQKLKANNIFSIEPGLYKEGIGGVRLENSVCTVKTKDGIKIETLTNLPFDEKLITFDMLTKKELKLYNEYGQKALK